MTLFAKFLNNTKKSMPHNTYLKVSNYVKLYYMVERGSMPVKVCIEIF